MMCRCGLLACKSLNCITPRIILFLNCIVVTFTPRATSWGRGGKLRGGEREEVRGFGIRWLWRRWWRGPWVEATLVVLALFFGLRQASQEFIYFAF